MSQQETAEIEEIEIEASSDEVNSESEDGELPTYEDYLALKERLEKAEKKIVEQKKIVKKKPEETADRNVDVDALVEQKLAEREFYRENPDAKPYKEKIDSYVKRGLSIDEAYLLASKKDREIEANSDAYGKSQVAGSGQGSDNVAIVTVAAFDKMTPAQQSDYLAKTSSKFGEVRFK